MIQNEIYDIYRLISNHNADIDQQSADKFTIRYYGYDYYDPIQVIEGYMISQGRIWYE